MTSFSKRVEGCTAEKSCFAAGKTARSSKSPSHYDHRSGRLHELHNVINVYP